MLSQNTPKEMPCPKCGAFSMRDSRVEEVEGAGLDRMLTRRKKCGTCGTVFRTVEMYDPFKEPTKHAL